jgi:diadenosine tetraphosphate (Ap4A) HIT family hydrolase
VPTIFSRIIDGELPGRFVWRDERCVVFLSINPLAPGHALVVPVAEVDHWIDLPADDAAHLMRVAHAVGSAQQDAFSPARIGVVIAGFEVPHAHVHVVPVDGMAQLDFANVATDVTDEAFDDAASKLRAALQANGHPEVVTA